jgi:hypothetical protein
VSLAALGVVVLIVAIIALRHPGTRVATAGSLTRSPSSATGTTSAARTTPPPTQPQTQPAHTTPAPSRSVTGRLPLVVLNNTTTNGLATRAANTFRAGGWTVTGIDNLHDDIISTCAYYDPSVAGAQAAAQALRTQFPAIKRVAPKFDALPAGPIVVVLTPDYAGG